MQLAKFCVPLLLTCLLLDLQAQSPSLPVWTWQGGLAPKQRALPLYGDKLQLIKPGARYESATWVGSDGSLWLYGGNAWGEGQDQGPSSDLWKYLPNENRWIWMHGSKTTGQAPVYGTQGVGTDANTPGARIGFAHWTDLDGNFWLMGGMLPASQELLNDLWKFDVANNQWIWINGSSSPSFGDFGQLNVANATNQPPSRKYASYWSDANGRFWLFGGQINSQSSASLLPSNDLWVYNTNTNQWTWVGGSTDGSVFSNGTLGIAHSANQPSGRWGGSVVADGYGKLWMFGGFGYALTATPNINNGLEVGLLNDLWSYDIATAQWTWVSGASSANSQGEYGTLGTEDAANQPPSRSKAKLWVNQSNQLIMWSGSNSDLSDRPMDVLNDLWSFDFSTKLWVWERGGNQLNVPSIPGSAYEYAAENAPGGRMGAATWKTADGNIWMFGGIGIDSVEGTTSRKLNDFWKFSNSLNQWSLLTYGNSGYGWSVYGSKKGIQSITPNPQSREGSLSWTDASGNFWLMGGRGYDGSNQIGNFNDLWKLNLQNQTWSWIHGDSTKDPIVVSASLGNPSQLNNPIPIPYAPHWKDQQGNFWFLGAEFRENSSGNWDDVWKYNPIRQQWTWVKQGASVYASGPLYTVEGEENVDNTPGIRFGASTWVDASGNFWLFGGNSTSTNRFGNSIDPNNQVYNDLWKFSTSSQMWTCVRANSYYSYGAQGIPSASNQPEPRAYASCWQKSDGTVWIFGGLSALVSISENRRNNHLSDLWKYVPTTNTWTWMRGGQDESNPIGDIAQVYYPNYGNLKVTSAENQPGVRSSSSFWTDVSGNFWMYGGEGFNGTGQFGNLADLWKLDPNTAHWTWMNGNTEVYATPNFGSKLITQEGVQPGGKTRANAWVDAQGRFWMYGGMHQSNFNSTSNGIPEMRNELWSYLPSNDQWIWIMGDSIQVKKASYGAKGLASSQVFPGSVYRAASWKEGNNLWMYGGHGFNSTGDGALASLWKYQLANGLWSWEGGSKFLNDAPVYGTLKQPDASVSPGSLYSNMTWTDKQGNLWIYTTRSFWKYQKSLGQWTWMGGGDDNNFDTPVYGERGVAAVGNWPGSRVDATVWTDSSGKFWLFGGYGTGAVSSNTGYLNSLWSFDPNAEMWTWESGQNNTGAIGEWGTKGMAAVNNSPSARSSSIPWIDQLGKLWFFGGYGDNAVLKDVWKFDPVTKLWTWMHGPDESNPTPVYGTLGQPSDGNIPPFSNGSQYWSDLNGNFWMNGGANRNDLWKFDPIQLKWTWEKGEQFYNDSYQYGTMGSSSASNLPIGRTGAVTWTDAAGKLWMRGGVINVGGLFEPILSDLWSLEVPVVYYRDNDGDGYGDANNSTTGSTLPQGYVYNRQDCDDTNAAIHPGAEELADGIDNDCDGVVDNSSLTFYKDQDGDGHGNPLDFVLAATAPSGYVSSNDDCNDADATIYPGAPEICDSKDNDCDGQADNLRLYEWVWMNGSNSNMQSGVYGVKGTAAALNKPGSRTEAVQWTDANGNVWLFGGTGLDASGQPGTLNDLWKYNVTTNQWTWVNGSNSTSASGVYGTKGTASVANTPGARQGAIGWTDANGQLWLFGGIGKSATDEGYLNDLWKFDVSNLQWTWVAGSNAANASGNYGSKGSGTFSTQPGARAYAHAFQGSDSKIWMFGGSMNTDISSFIYNDLWSYDPASNIWTWEGGSNESSKGGIYGNQQMADVANMPGARLGAFAWSDGAGALWLYGGSGNGEENAGMSNSGYLNDLWKFDIGSGQWTWMAGDKQPSNMTPAAAFYGDQGIGSSSNTPGARTLGGSWTGTQNGQLWLMGGFGAGEVALGGPTQPVNPGFMNDLWMFDTQLLQWTWVAGDKTPNQTGNYGTALVSSATNKIGGRQKFMANRGAGGKVWVFGGNGYDAVGNGDLNDLWRLNLPPANLDTFYQDADGDNYGNAAVFVTACTNPAGYVSNATDCNDNDANVYPFVNTTNQTACGSYIWNVNGATYTQSGTYTYVNGCDIQQLQLVIQTATSETITATACDSYTWGVNGQTYTSSGTYSSVNECATEILNLTITPSTSNTTTESACDSYTWPVNGQTYTSSGTYSSVNGCATEYLNLTITPSTSNTTTESACDSYTWAVNGQTYTSSGTYSYVNGCATEYLNLTITPSTSNTTTESACDSYTWGVNGQTYTSSGTYSYVNGCATEILNLTITTSTSNTTTESACDSYTWGVNGQTYTSSGTYSSVNGCATEYLNLTITPSTSNTTTESACDSYTWGVNGQTYTSSGTYSYVNGCNTEYLNLTITPSTSNTTTESACDSYTWAVNGQTYTSSGTYSYVNGCATEILNLTITPSTSNTTTESACDSYTWPVNGQTYTSSGTYSYVNGCATEILNLTVTPSTSNTTTESACDSYTWGVNGQTYTSSGTYSYVNGCATEYLNLTITPSTSNTTTESACDSYTWGVNGQTYTSSGTYSSVNECATEILNLTITPSTSNTTTESACDSYTWPVNGQTYTSSGTYSSVNGCNTEYLNLTITPSTSNTTTESACDSYTWAVDGQTYTSSGTYSYVNGCATEILNLTITPITSSTTTQSSCDSYTWSVTGQTYTSSGTYTSVNGCDTRILNLTITPSTSNTTTVNACGNYTWSVNGQTYNNSGTYTSINGCHTEILQLTLNGLLSNVTLQLSKTDVSCFGGSNGVVGVVVSPAGTYTYSIDNGAFQTRGTFTGLSAGTHLVTIRNAAGCTKSASIEILQPAALVTSALLSQVTCRGSANGAIDLTIQGGTAPYSYLWNTRATTQDISGLVARVYTVNITDAKACRTSASYTITQPAALALVNTLVPATCNGSATGSITPVASGGTAPYQYQLSNGAQLVNGAFSNLAAGTYAVTVIDANGCSFSSNAVITQPTAFSFTIRQTNVTSCSPNGSITVRPAGGTAPYSYSLDAGQNWQTSTIFNNLASGTYQIRVKDAKSCITNSLSVNLTDNGNDVYEANNVRTTATLATLESLLTARIGRTGDLDWYSFTTPAGAVQNYYLSFEQSVTGLAQVYELFATTGAGNVINPAGQEVVVTPNLRYKVYALNPSTRYLVRVSGAFSMSCYGLKLSTTPPVSTNLPVAAWEKMVATDENLPLAVRAYPNPTNGMMKLKLEGFPKGKAFIRLIDARGRSLMQRELELLSNQQEWMVDLSAYAQGAYLLQVNGGGKMKVLKIMKE